MFSIHVTTYHHLISQADWNRCNLSINLSWHPFLLWARYCYYAASYVAGRPCTGCPLYAIGLSGCFGGCASGTTLAAMALVGYSPPAIERGALGSEGVTLHISCLYGLQCS